MPACLLLSKAIMSRLQIPQEEFAHERRCLLRGCSQEDREAITSFKDQTNLPMPPSTIIFFPTNVALQDFEVSAANVWHLQSHEGKLLIRSLFKSFISMFKAQEKLGMTCSTCGRPLALEVRP